MKLRRGDEILVKLEVIRQTGDLISCYTSSRRQISVAEADIQEVIYRQIGKDDYVTWEGVHGEDVCGTVIATHSGYAWIEFETDGIDHQPPTMIAIKSLTPAERLPKKGKSDGTDRVNVDFLMRRMGNGEYWRPRNWRAGYCYISGDMFYEQRPDASNKQMSSPAKKAVQFAIGQYGNRWVQVAKKAPYITLPKQLADEDDYNDD